MLRRIASIPITVVMAFSIGVPTAEAGDRTCRGTLGAITVDDNLLVPRGATCVLNGTNV